MRRVLVASLTLVLLASLAACESSNDPDVADDAVADASGDVAADAVADATVDAAPDVAADTADTVPDTTPDVAGDTAADTVPDTAADTGPEVCTALTQAAESERATAAAGCTEPLGCTWFEYPICGSFGCFHGAVRKDADFTALGEAATAAGAAGCEPFHCGCGPPEGTPVCLGGSCEQCPPDCGTDCGELETAFNAAAAKAAAGCTHDLDCQTTPVGHCSLGPQIACHTMAWHTDPSPAIKLLEGYLGAAGCPDIQCDCLFDGARCEAGVCVPALKPAVLCGTSVEEFPTFADNCTDVAECALVTHGTDCCGNAAVWGLRADEVAPFNKAEAMCQSQMAECACPAFPPVAEDGNSAWNLDDVKVRCEAGHCQSYVPAP